MDGAIFILADFNDRSTATTADYTTLLGTDLGSAAPGVAQKNPLFAFNPTPFPVVYPMEKSIQTAPTTSRMAWLESRNAK